MKAIEQLASILKKRCGQARRDPERFERKVVRPPQVDALVQNIRDGRKLAKREEPQDREVSP